MMQLEKWRESFWSCSRYSNLHRQPTEFAILYYRICNSQTYSNFTVHCVMQFLGFNQSWRLKLPSQQFELHEHERERYITNGEEQLLYIPCFRSFGAQLYIAQNSMLIWPGCCC